MPAQAQVTGIVDGTGVRMWTVENVGDTLLLPRPPQTHLGAEGVRPRGLGRDLYMGDSRRTSLRNQPSSEAEGRSERELSGDPRGLQSSVYESRRATDPEHQDLDNAELGPEDPEEELPPEEVAGEEFSETLDPKEALSELEGVLGKDLEEDIPEISRLSISQKLPSTIMAKARRKRRRRRLMELAEPKINWQVLRDRPSVYWTERFLEDTTLTITVPAVSRRVEELSRPRRFYLEYYNNNRTTPVWPIPRSCLEYRATSRLKELAAPKIRNNIWSVPMSEVSQVSRAAQMAVPSSRILQLSKPKAPATLLEEWDPMPKPKPHASDYNRLLHLARPKAQSDKCVPDRDPRWVVLDVTKKVVASPRIISLAQPKVRKCLNEGHNPYSISPASLVAQASPRLYELATPKSITRKV
ncbi:PREDICTED: testicular haploid expressed gene protein isoform X2 [Cercocebus atys]|uniref:testicular haploid expressed gene protein isoform X2 n=1 Tax=Cercocebus atys TaxID=9531 RepID=UPI0005F3A33F|nr:PREDICTED: testicular haploid expressed gene protein isoform X2 [Cercocebus atys]